LEEVTIEVTKTYKAIELFKTMAIMSLSMGSLILKVNTLKNKLVMGDKEKVMLQEELDKEKKFQKGYKHNAKILRKNMVEVE
jgi:hypothetical protein